MTSEEADSVKNALDSAIKAASDKKSVNDALSAVEKAINSVSKENAKKILLNDLAYSKKIASAAEKIPARIDVKKDGKNDGSDVSGEASEVTNPPMIRNDKLTVTIIICGLAVVIAAIVAILLVRKKNSKK
jgi:cytochrome oxidase assembly protein ShyY1